MKSYLMTCGILLVLFSIGFVILAPRGDDMKNLAICYGTWGIVCFILAFFWLIIGALTLIAAGKLTAAILLILVFILIFK